MTSRRNTIQKDLVRNTVYEMRRHVTVSYTHLHLLIPIITSVIFLIYYFFSPWNENMKVIAFYQAIGAGPVSYTHLDVYKRQRLYYQHKS